MSAPTSVPVIPAKEWRVVKDWHWVVTRSWSMRLAIVAALLSGAETILPLFINAMPRGYFAIASFVITVAAVIARFVAQREQS